MTQEEQGAGHPAGAKRRRWKVDLLTALLTLSLLTQAWTLYTLARLRSTAVAQIDALAEQLDQAERQRLSATVLIDRPLPLRAAVPISQRLTIPISTTVPISQQFVLPLSTPLGSVDLPIPLRLDVPFRAEVPITFAQTVDISTTVDLDLQLPISVPISDTSLAEPLRQLREQLRQLRDNL
ncbi:MAG TPA: hypothetical protein VFS21_19605 [Roseiflexaceae bacterium]|nr:hypothetical protein [Roseiflexaceae bacterium]